MERVSKGEHCYRADRKGIGRNMLVKGNGVSWSFASGGKGNGRESIASRKKNMG